MADELAAAVLRGAVDEARALLAAGANARDASKHYPRQWSLLFGGGAAPLLNLAALLGSAAMVKLLLEHGADVNEHPLLEHRCLAYDDTFSVAGDSALTMAAGAGFLDVVRVLVQAGADLRGATREASQGKHLEVADFLRAAKKRPKRPKPSKPSKPAVYTQLWPERIVAPLRGVVDGQPLRRIVSWSNRQSDFGRSRVAVGDVVVAFHIVKARICPIARMTLAWKGVVRDWNERIPAEGVPPVQTRIREIADDGPVENLDLQLLVGDGGTAQHFARPLPVEFLRALRYDSARGPRPLPLMDDGSLVRPATVDGLFRLIPESGDELLWLPWI